MATHRSAMGKEVDMSALRQRNEKTRAIGNMNVNARGDIIDSNGQVINDNNKRVNEYYMKSVINRGIRPTSAAPKREVKETAPVMAQTMPKVDEKQVEMTKEELEFDQEDTIIVEPKSKKSDSSKKID
jgi:hypothetical protein